MQKIINSKEFDKDNAKFIDSRREFYKEFIYYSETLFQGEDGSYFLHVDALYNPLWYGKYASAKELFHSDIYALTDEEAANWLSSGD